MRDFHRPAKHSELAHDHRRHFTPIVRDALALLDRVEDGQPVPSHLVQAALVLTGDAAMRGMRGYARPTQLRATDGPTDAGEGRDSNRPTFPREPHPQGDAR